MSLVIFLNKLSKLSSTIEWIVHSQNRCITKCNFRVTAANIRFEVRGCQVFDLLIYTLFN
mgnify:CR=1 FL=1